MVRERDPSADSEGYPESHDGGAIQPDEMLPDESILTVDEYLQMQRAIGERTRFRIIRTLRNDGELSPTEIGEQLAVESSNLHHHLNKLVEVGLVEKRQQKQADESGLYTYYRVTPMGEVILDHGVEELMRREWDYVEEYSSAA